jgi:hypothetical protein
VSKETYYSVKRDLLQCQKRPTTVSKETYYSVKREVTVGHQAGRQLVRGRSRRVQVRGRVYEQYGACSKLV